MPAADPQTTIANAIATLDLANREQTGGKWLENEAVQVARYIREWDITECWAWAEWPDREIHFPEAGRQDVGIDCVAVRRSDGEYIAIQCKARQLDEYGRGSPINKEEFDSFASASSDDFWAERWIITNGDNPLGRNVRQTLAMTSKPVKMVNIAHDLQQQQTAFVRDEECAHCQPHPEGEWRKQSRTCMQAEAIEKSISVLRAHEQSSSGGLPVGQARGKLILPCGTGKTRISLRIIEQLTLPGELSIVLCPSIALVAQIRREYMQHGEVRALAVCSDESAGYDPTKESAHNTAENPTLDNSNTSAAVVKGKVTTDPAEIAQWIREGEGAPQINVIFGTYQSGSRISEALLKTGFTAKVLICDEAHRTAGLRRKGRAQSAGLSEAEQRIRDFTLCHDNDAFPATYRIYQTATPRIYDARKVNQAQDSNWLVRTMDDESVFGVELYRKSYVEAVENEWLADYRIIAVAVNQPDAYRCGQSRWRVRPRARGRNGSDVHPLPARPGLRPGHGRRDAKRLRRDDGEAGHRAHQVLHRLYEHRGQVQKYGRGIYSIPRPCKDGGSRNWLTEDYGSGQKLPPHTRWSTWTPPAT